MQYHGPLSSKNNPVYIIGAGGIINTAHLPAYKIAGFNVQGIYDIDHAKAIATAANFNVPNVFNSVAEMVAHATANAIFDVAVPGSQTMALLNELPVGATVLLQKPMGENYAEAQQILAVTQQKKCWQASIFNCVMRLTF
ncbi:MAG: Gfo/Idh/MocA family oxidoreductase [Ferruginibacter sp.]